MRKYELLNLRANEELRNNYKDDSYPFGDEIPSFVEEKPLFLFSAIKFLSSISNIHQLRMYKVLVYHDLSEDFMKFIKLINHQAEVEFLDKIISKKNINLHVLKEVFENLSLIKSKR